MESHQPRSLSPELLAALAESGEPRVFARDELLISEGEPSDSLYTPVSGEINIFIRDKRGRELVCNVLQA